MILQLVGEMIGTVDADVVRRLRLPVVCVNLDRPHFDKVLKGTKDIETRARSRKRGLGRELMGLKEGALVVLLSKVYGMGVLVRVEETAVEEHGERVAMAIGFKKVATGGVEVDGWVGKSGVWKETVTIKKEEL